MHSFLFLVCCYSAALVDSYVRFGILLFVHFFPPLFGAIRLLFLCLMIVSCGICYVRLFFLVWCYSVVLFDMFVNFEICCCACVFPCVVPFGLLFFDMIVHTGYLLCINGIFPVWCYSVSVMFDAFISFGLFLCNRVFPCLVLFGCCSF